jgi:lipoprotein signal peptidase
MTESVSEGGSPLNSFASFKRTPSLLNFGVLIIGGTILAVIIAAACGNVLDRLYPSSGLLTFAAYFVVHIAALSVAWAVAFRFS